MGDSNLHSDTMPALLGLPVELLIKIAKLVPEPIHLTLVCRVLNDVATPVVYRTLTLPSPSSRCNPKPGTIARILGHLLRTLMARPSIGVHVQHLEISFVDVPSIFARNWEKMATRIPEDICIPALEAAASHGLGDSLQEDLEDGLLGTALFLLLCYLPNLDSLDVAPEFRSTFFSHIASSRMLPSGLRSLRSVFIDQPNSRDNNVDKEIFTLFRLPSLQILGWDIRESFHYEDSTPPDQVAKLGGRSKIEDINIKSNHVDASVLAEMVRSVQHLRSFHYDQSDGFSHKPFFGDIFSSALEAHAHNLEDLEIQVIDNNEKRHRPIGSLRQYSKLTRLAVAMPVLFGSPDPQPTIEMHHPPRIGELLPESLVTLEIYVDRDWVDTACGHLTQLIEVDLKYVPNLKRLALHAWTSQLDMSTLLPACYASGIILSVRRYH